MTDLDLDAMIDALRERGEAAPRQAETTRRRVMASLEERNTGRRRRVAVIVTALTLGTGTLSWAATTGRLAPVLAKLGLGEGERAAIEPERSVIDRVRRPRGARAAAPDAPFSLPVPAPVPDEPMPSAQPTIPEPPLPSPPPPSRRRARARVELADDGTVQFRRANQLHVSGEAAAALAAWDDYLIAHPTGALAIEARYNRALVLVRLRRWDDALAALAPFVGGEVTPAGYRQADAIALAGAIERRVVAARKRGTP